MKSEVGHLYHDSHFSGGTLEAREHMKAREVNAREKRLLQRADSNLRQAREACSRRSRWEKDAVRRDLRAILERTPTFHRTLNDEKQRFTDHLSTLYGRDSADNLKGSRFARARLNVDRRLSLYHQPPLCGDPAGDPGNTRPNNVDAHIDNNGGSYRLTADKLSDLRLSLAAKFPGGEMSSLRQTKRTVRLENPRQDFACAQDSRQQDSRTRRCFESERKDSDCPHPTMCHANTSNELTETTLRDQNLTSPTRFKGRKARGLDAPAGDQPTLDIRPPPRDLRHRRFTLEAPRIAANGFDPRQRRFTIDSPGIAATQGFARDQDLSRWVSDSSLFTNGGNGGPVLDDANPEAPTVSDKGQRLRRRSHHAVMTIVRVQARHERRKRQQDAVTSLPPLRKVGTGSLGSLPHL